MLLSDLAGLDKTVQLLAIWPASISKSTNSGRSTIALGVEQPQRNEPAMISLSTMSVSPCNCSELWMAAESEFDQSFENSIRRNKSSLRSAACPVNLHLRENCRRFLLLMPLSPIHHNTLIGPMSRIRTSTAKALAFFKKYYVPSNMIIAIVGDVI